MQTGAVSTTNAAGMNFRLFNNFRSSRVVTSSFLGTTTSGGLTTYRSYTTYRSTFARAQGLGGAGIVGSAYPDRLGSGDPINGGNSFASFSTLDGVSSFGFANGNFPRNQPGFLGLRFSIGPDTFFGWALIEVESGGSVTLQNFAYEACAGQGIQAGATTGGGTCGPANVPEPHSAALVALGAAGLVSWRRRRKAA